MFSTYVNANLKHTLLQAPNPTGLALFVGPWNIPCTYIHIYIHVSMHLYVYVCIYIYICDYVYSVLWVFISEAPVVSKKEGAELRGSTYPIL